MVRGSHDNANAQGDKRERIARLKDRVKKAAQDGPGSIVLAGILLGILDLLADEL